MKLLHIFPMPSEGKRAKEKVIENHRQIFRHLLEAENICCYEVASKKRIPLDRILNFVFYKRYSGMTSESEEDILLFIKENKIDTVFVESSQWGFLVKKIKQHTICNVIVQCYDVEKKRIESLIKAAFLNKRWREYVRFRLLKRIAIVNEKATIRYSDYIVALTNQDRNDLQALYGQCSVIVIPSCLKDEFTGHTGDPPGEPKLCQNLLFVGMGSYLPNLVGIKMFITEVLPYINAKLMVVGKDTELLREQYQNCERLDIIGSVERLEDYYVKADAVINPVVFGGGIQTKTIEAFMFGKFIFGTSSSFSGIDIENIDLVGKECNNSGEFIQALQHIEVNAFHRESREIYLEKYSMNAVTEKMRKLFDLAGKGQNDKVNPSG